MSKVLNSFSITFPTDLRVKTYRGEPLPGWGWCELGQKAVEALNQGKIPSIENHTATLLRLGVERAMFDANRTWKDLTQQWMFILSQGHCVMDSVLHVAIQEAQKKVIEKFQSHLFGGENSETDRTKEKLVRDLQQDYSHFEAKQSRDGANVDPQAIQ